MIESESVQVVGAVIIGVDGFLVARRSSPMKLPGKWEFPGGKVEAGESPQEALEREIREELGVHIRVGDHVTTTDHVYEFARIQLSTFYAEIVAGTPIATEHAELRWCRASELMSLAWAPADIPSAERVVAKWS